MSTRGYFGVGIVNGKTEANIGTLWRTATAYGASFIFTVGSRYSRQASDTCNSSLHMPLHEFTCMDDLLAHLPYGCPLVGVEMDPRADRLADLKHPMRACYLLGAEDHGLSPAVLDRCHALVQVETPVPWSLNVATAGALVLADRYAKSRQAVTA